jgi:hypothetical protein
VHFDERRLVVAVMAFYASQDCAESIVVLAPVEAVGGAEQLAPGHPVLNQRRR